MAEKGFGVKEINLIGASGTPTIESPNNLNLNAVNVAISTNATIGGNLTVTGNIGVAGTLTYEDVTNIDSVGIITARDGIFIPDNKNIHIGNASGNGDLQIYHDSSNSYIKDQGTGQLVIDGNAVILQYSASTKLETTNTGVSVSGTLAATAVTGDGSGLTNVPGATPSDTDVQVTFDIAGDSSGGYTFTGPGNDGTTGNPDIYLLRGQRYRFINTTGSSHPFEFRNADNSADFTDGITGSQSGTQDFNVQYDAPAHLKYRCTIHTGSMIGNIYIRSGADTGASAGTENIEIGGFLRFDNTVSKIITDTSDGSDNKAILISGGGDTATSRGALAILYGNELNSGRLDLYSGVGGGDITFNTGTTTTEKLRITSTGQLLVGTGSASNRFKNGNGNGATPKFQFETANVDEQNDISLTFGRNNAFGAEIILAKHRASTVGGYTVVQSNDRLGGINFAGADGTHFHPAALIQGRVDGTPGTGDMPGRLEFLTTSDGASTPTERLRILSSGKINIGDTDLNQTTDQFCVSITAQNAIDNVVRFQSAAAASGTSESLVKIYKGAGYGGVISGYITQGSDHGMKFYTADNGSLTERLRISKLGITKPSNPAFHARPPGNYTIPNNGIIGGTWSTSDSESFVRGTLANGNSIWDNSTGIFTVPVTGIYYIHWNVFLANNTTRRDAMIYNGNTIIARTEIGDPGESGNNKSVSVSTVVSLTVNDQIKFGALTTGGTQIYQTVRPWSYACAYLVG